MFKRIALLLLILLLPVFCAAGFYGYVWWKIRESAETLATTLSPFVDLSYGQVHVDLMATEVGLKDIQLIPVGATDLFSIDELVIKTADWSQMLYLDENLQKGELPTLFSVRQSGLLVNLNGSFIQQWGPSYAEAQQALIDTGTFCGDAQGTDLARAMGYSSLSNDTTFNYSFDAMAGEAVIDIESDTAQIGSVSMEVKLQVQGESVSAPAVMMGAIALKSFRMNYQDKGYNRRYRNYCTKEAGIADEQFDSLFQQELHTQLAQEGVRLTQSQELAIVALNRSGVDFSVSVNPLVPLGGAYQPEIESVEGFLEVLNPEIRISGDAVSLEGIRWQEPVFEPEPEVAVSPSVTGPVVDSVPEQAQSPGSSADPRLAKNKEQRRAFSSIEVGELKHHVGARARMVTYFGRRIEGRVLEVGATDVMIEQRMAKGIATYAISLGKVAEVEVFQ